MASLIPSFEYDIFISYRQKDNKGDHWVTGFVDALKTELESTFKEDIAIYFDENPHDGLHEMHDVDGSLKEKIKCLIFIPFLSRTYCDPQSFAWQHEFLPFRDFATGDGFGLKVRLANGNVTSRILPVRIYELSAEDAASFETETKGPIRAIDFVFKSAGVNRPLLPTDKKEDNLSHTVYRDQVNKLANVIGDIIASMKKPAEVSTHQSENKQQAIQTPDNVSRKKTWTSVIGLLVLVAAIWFGTKLLNSNQPEEVPDKSIAVLPFTDISDAKDQAYFSDGMMVEILDHLFKIPGLRIIPRNSTLAYKNSNKSLKEIAKELTVVNLIQGSVRKSGNRVKISIQLINGLTEQYLWQQTYDRDLADVFAVQSDVATQIANALKAQITPEVKDRIRAIPTKNQEAYDLYLKGNEEAGKTWETFDTRHMKDGIGYFKSAIALDSTFADAYTSLGNCYWGLAHFDPIYTSEYWKQSKTYLTKAIALDPTSGWAYSSMAVVQQLWDLDRIGARQSFKKAIQLTPSNPNIHNDLFYFYWRTMDCDSMRITNQTIKTLKPEFYSHNHIVFTYICSRNLTALNTLSPPESIISLDGTSEMERLLILKRYADVIAQLGNLNMESMGGVLGFIVEPLGTALALSGKKTEARALIEKYENQLKSKNQLSAIAAIYMALGEEDKAYGYLEKALADRDLRMHELPYMAAFYFKRDDPRFKAFMARTWVN